MINVVANLFFLVCAFTVILFAAGSTIVNVAKNMQKYTRDPCQSIEIDRKLPHCGTL